MKIDGNEDYMKALACYLQGDKKTYQKLEDEFLAQVYAEGKDHCPCHAPCKHHGDCKACIILHRGHRDHLPYCLHDMINERLDPMIRLVEGNVSDRTPKK